MAEINDLSATVKSATLTFDANELAVLHNLLYRTQLSMAGPGAVTADILDAFDIIMGEMSEAAPHHLEMYAIEGGSLYWGEGG